MAERVPVLVVGAGPVGLTMAAEYADTVSICESSTNPPVAPTSPRHCSMEPLARRPNKRHCRSSRHPAPKAGLLGPEKASKSR
jgi:thioredoxin reductase